MLLNYSTTSTKKRESYSVGASQTDYTRHLIPFRNLDDDIDKQETGLELFDLPKAFWTTAQARGVIRGLDNRDVADTANKTLDIFAETVYSFEDKSSLPPLEAFEGEDGSVLMEWIFPNLRIGLSIEVDPTESGWYVVSDNTLGLIHASGYLSDSVVNWLVSWLVSGLKQMPLSG